MRVEILEGSQAQWDEYVLNHNNASIYHLYTWGAFFNDIYNFETMRLVAYENDDIVGLVILVVMKNHFAKKIMVSLPFFCVGGILASNKYAEQIILRKIKEITTGKLCKYTLLRNENVYDVLQYDYIEQNKSTRQYEIFMLASQHNTRKHIICQ